MEKISFKLALSGVLLLSPCFANLVSAATPVNLAHQNVSILQALISPTGAAQNLNNIVEFRRSMDRKQTLHIRVQQMYAGYPVIGADGVVHIPKGVGAPQGMQNIITVAKNANATLNGTMYQNLQADLANTSPSVLTEAQSKKAIQEGINLYQQKNNARGTISEQKSERMIYVDADNKAHWVYRVSFFVAAAAEGKMPAKPVFILDATTFKVYQQWDNIKTLKPVEVLGGGFGGNKKMGKLIYDGLADNLPKLNVMFDKKAKTCYWQNTDVTVKHFKNNKVMTFKCESPDPEHNDVYWIGDLDAVNGGYSPSDDALFGGAVIKDMYQKWYNVPVLTENGKPMMLNMVVHDPIDNAYWDGRQMTFGDGQYMFYPLTSLGVAAHEISHGFTEQHSDLAYYRQSGGMNEAFSDMAAQAAEFYAYGKNSWQIGPEIFKSEDEALRYMDQPSKDCGDKEPGDWCSIDNVKQYKDGLDVHYSSGVYNRAFYLMGTATDWNTRKAFDVMVKANMDYWTSNVDFKEGACGVMKATKDLDYDTQAVVNAFKKVGIDTTKC